MEEINYRDIENARKYAQSAREIEIRSLRGRTGHVRPERHGHKMIRRVDFREGTEGAHPEGGAR